MRWLSLSAKFISALPLYHKYALAILVAIIVLMFFHPAFNYSITSVPLSLSHLEDTVYQEPEIILSKKKAPWELDKVPAKENLLVYMGRGSYSYQYIVRKGDTLSKLFHMLQLPQKTMYQLLETDLNVLALDSLQPGHRLIFQKKPDGELQRLELQFNLAHKVIYQRKEDNGFEFEEIQLKGDWRQLQIAGKIQNSFAGSSELAGLTRNESQTIIELLKDRFNFKRDLRRGDEFRVLVSRQYIGDEATGKNIIEAVQIKGRHRTISAFLFEDNYFDQNGGSLEKAFQRYPFKGHYRLTSGFNPRRRHPVTGLIRPHNGTDFGMRIGSPVRTTGDGIVTRVIRHRYAGLYIEIRHGQHYKTRYLHLSKALVKKGQKVERGQQIAKSGNTGRSTGPHLHFELHYKGRPVDAMKAKIPIAINLTGKKRKLFKQQLKLYLKKLYQDNS